MLMLLVASGMLVMPGKFSFLCASRYSLGFFMPSFMSSFIFNPALFSIQIHGEYSHGLSLLCQVPVPVNDPMAFDQRKLITMKVQYFHFLVKLSGHIEVSTCPCKYHLILTFS